MKWQAFATDFDGTIATDGVLLPETVETLNRLTAASIPVILVTGRELSDFLTLDVDPKIFKLIVAENGALVHDPFTGENEIVGAPPPPGFVAELQRRGVGPISVGASIVATWEPHENAVLQTIKDMALELQVIFNKGAVMILPAGVNKASGLRIASRRLGFEIDRIIGAGDAENDHSFLAICGLSVAVGNALPALKQKVDVVTTGARGAGVAEFTERLLQGEFDLFERSMASLKK